MATEEKVLLKDQLFNENTVRILTKCLGEAYPKLNQVRFIEDIIEEFHRFELKERITWIRKIIEKHISEDYKMTIGILKKSLKDMEEDNIFVFAAYSDYVMANGCYKAYVDVSLSALGVFTKYLSAEFAIRRFINEFPVKTYNQMMLWAKSDNVHQRRLASEGLRPKLPWAIGISIDYKKAIKVLEYLYYDRDRYVTRSVANHLNDVSKIDPNLVVEKLKTWQKSEKQNNKEMHYIKQHSLRTSIKRGHINTLEFLGYSHNPKIKISNFKIVEDTIHLGEVLEFSFDIEAMENERLIIDYKVTYPMLKNRKSEKVFKIKQMSIGKQDKVAIIKKHRFKKMTTKILYQGTYTLELQINGMLFDSKVFTLNI